MGPRTLVVYARTRLPKMEIRHIWVTILFAPLHRLYKAQGRDGHARTPTLLSH